MGSPDATASVSNPAACFKPPTTRRTNSLGWAKSNCHSCEATSRMCDRKRPRCDACTDRGRVCGGYAQTLKWQDQGKRTRPSTAKTIRVNGPKNLSSSIENVEYSFVQEDERLARNYGKASKPPQNVSHERLRKQPSGTAQMTSENPEDGLFNAEAGLLPVLYTCQPDYFTLPPSTTEEVAFFRWTFSPVTLTYEIKANPWQACIPQIDRAPFLLYAVQALSIRHRSHLENTPESVSVLELKDKALSSFAQSINAVPLEVGISASLLLMGIDYAESAFGSWIIHLRGIYRMIESAGGIQLGNGDMHLRAQIAQLVWYDTIIALLSRRDPVFPKEYVETILSWKNESHWSLLALNGFPDGAFLHMHEIAEAAAHATSLSEGHVTGLEMKLWLIRFETEQGATDPEMAALTECWRLGLLLYCTRIFYRGEATKKKARVLAEEIMWLVHDIAPDSNKQKQALLPLFFAASEMESFRFRHIAVDFCERWTKKSGIWLNRTALELLETIWAAVDENQDQDIWWGDFVNPPPDWGLLFG